MLFMTGLPAFAGDDVFVLSNDQLDIVTAGGISVISNGFSSSVAFGDPALSDSLTSSSIDPKGGSADSMGFGLGSDGSQANAETSTTAAGDNVVANANSFADGISFEDEITLVTSTSILSLGDSQLEVGSTATGTAQEAFTTGSTGIDYADASNQISSGAEGTGLDLNGSGSKTKIGTLLRGTRSGFTISSDASSTGGTFNTTEARTSTSSDTGTIGIQTESLAQTASAGSGDSKVTTTVNSRGPRVIVRSMASATQTGEALMEPKTDTSVTFTDVPDTANVRGISRTISRTTGFGGFSRSFTIQMLTK